MHLKVKLVLLVVEKQVLLGCISQR
ncbi:hypothetical protein LINGRAHAP2_LOCUS2273 [Linum grandiflorum]